MVGVFECSARSGVYPLRPPSQCLIDERPADASVGSGNHDCLICNVHTLPFRNLNFFLLLWRRDKRRFAAPLKLPLTVGGNYAKVAEGLNVAALRVEKPAEIVPAIKKAIAVTQSGAPFLLEFVVKEGYDFSRYALAGL